MSETRGFFRVARRIFHTPVLQESSFSKRDAWLWMISTANWKTNMLANGIELERGCLMTSIRRLGDAWGWDKNRVSRFLTALERESMVRTKTVQKCTHIEIAKYEQYQTDSPDDEKIAGQEPRKKRGNNQEQKKETIINNTSSSLPPYAGPDGSGNVRDPHPQFPRVHLSAPEHLRACERMKARGLRPESFILAVEKLHAWLGKENNLAKSKCHYDSLIGWPLDEALKSQTNTDRATRAAEVKSAPLPGQARETNYERGMKVLHGDAVRNQRNPDAVIIEIPLDTSALGRSAGGLDNGFRTNAPVRAGIGVGALPAQQPHALPTNSGSSVLNHARAESAQGSEVGVVGVRHGLSREASGASRSGQSQMPAPLCDLIAGAIGKAKITPATG